MAGSSVPCRDDGGEGAVVSEALEALKFGTPKLCTFGYSDDEAFSVGLTCGGTIMIYLEPVY